MDTPLLVAAGTFMVILFASSAAFLYFDSREAVQTWRRRAEGASEPEEAPAGVIDQLRMQCQDVLEWFGRLNQPSVEDVRSTRQQLINAGYRSGKVVVFFL